MARCVECGLIALRNVSTGELIEVDDDFRKWRKVTTLPAFDRQIEQYPRCVALAFDLVGECEDAAQRQATATALGEFTDWAQWLRPILEKDRPCKEFAEWRPGSSPKEHRDMVDRQRLLEFQRKREDDWQKWQADMAATDKAWREGQATEEKRWREEQERRVDRRHVRELQIVGGLVTIALILATLFGAILERGYFWPILRITQ